MAASSLLVNVVGQSLASSLAKEEVIVVVVDVGVAVAAVVIVAICTSVFTFVFAFCRAATSPSRPHRLFVALPAVEACALCGRVNLFCRKSTR